MKLEKVYFAGSIVCGLLYAATPIDGYYTAPVTIGMAATAFTLMWVVFSAVMLIALPKRELYLEVLSPGLYMVAFILNAVFAPDNWLRTHFDHLTIAASIFGGCYALINAMFFLQRDSAQESF
jgi:hypothetical protein